jgi:hypothetical protein
VKKLYILYIVGRAGNATEVALVVSEGGLVVVRRNVWDTRSPRIAGARCATARSAGSSISRDPQSLCPWWNLQCGVMPGLRKSIAGSGGTPAKARQERLWM